MLPKKPFTWVLLIIIAYGYFTIKADEPRDEPVQKMPELAIESTKPGGSILEKPVGAIINKISETAEGKAAVNAYLKESIRKKHGVDDAALIAAMERNKISKLDILKGTGAAAICGSKVKLNYESYIDEIIKVDSTIERNSPIIFTLGQGQVIEGLEKGIYGMKSTGVRKLAIPSSMAYDNPEFATDAVPSGKSVIMEVNMLEVKNGAKKLPSAMLSELKIGDGKEVFCGNKALLSYKISGYPLNGNLTLTIGDKETPILLEQIILGMKTNGIIKIITNSNELAPLIDDLPKNKNVTVEFELMAVS